MFEISTPLGFTVRTSETYWQKIIVKHPDIAEFIDLVQEALSKKEDHYGTNKSLLRT